MVHDSVGGLSVVNRAVEIYEDVISKIRRRHHPVPVSALLLPDDARVVKEYLEHLRCQQVALLWLAACQSRETKGSRGGREVCKKYARFLDFAVSVPLLCPKKMEMGIT